MKKILVTAAFVAAIVGTGFTATVFARVSGRNYDMRAGDRAFVNDAGVICTDQLLTALRATRPYARTLGRYGLVCIPTRGGLYNTYTVHVSELGLIVEYNRRVVFKGRNG